MSPSRTVGLLILIGGVALQPVGWMFSHWLTPVSFAAILVGVVLLLRSRDQDSTSGGSDSVFLTGRRCPVIFTAIAGKCQVVAPHHGNQAIPLIQVAQTEGALVTEHFFRPRSPNPPHPRTAISLQESAPATATPNITIHRTSGKLRLPASGDLQRYALRKP